MSQQKNPSRRQDNESRAYGRYFRTSPQKLNLVAQTIRGKNAGRALIDLEFSRRRIAQDVRKLLQSAIANAENNHGLDIDRLVVAEATVGKTMVLKRFSPRARGRAAGIQKKFSNMTIVLKQAVDGEEPAAAPKKTKAKSKAAGPAVKKAAKSAPKAKTSKKA